MCFYNVAEKLSCPLWVSKNILGHIGLIHLAFLVLMISEQRGEHDGCFDFIPALVYCVVTFKKMLKLFHWI